METQEQFLFCDGDTAELHLPHPQSSLFEEIAAIWQLPVGQWVHVALRGHSFADLHGRLELAKAPDLPLNAQETLALRIGSIEFTSRQIVAWALA